jgi:diguanylate cyclase (GGDEF)-like protein/PAS domain S-box-containing protein
MHALPITWRLTISMVVLVLVIIFSAAVLVVFHDTQQNKQHLRDETRISHQVLVQDLVRLVLINSVDIGANIVSRLQSFPAILHVDIRDQQGQPLLRYNKTAGLPCGDAVGDNKPEGFINDCLLMMLPIIANKQAIGSVRYAISTQLINQRLNEMTRVVEIISVAGIVFSVLGALCLQRFFTAPIKELINKTNRIAAGHDYTLRLKQTKHDLAEITTLKQSFNHMLSQIEHANRRLTLQKEQLEVTLNSIGDGVIVTDLNGRVVSMNPVASRLTGWPLESARSKDVGKVFQINDSKSGSVISNPVTRVLETEQIVDRHNCLLVSRHGDEYPIMDNAAPIKDKEKQLIGVILVFHDVTGHYQSIRRIEENEERLRRALDASSDGVWDWNIKTGEVIYSDKWCRSLGFDLSKVKPQISFWQELLHPDDEEATLYTLKQHFDGRSETYRQKSRLRTKSGEYRYNLGQGRVFEWAEDGTPLRMIGTDTDITEQQKALEELETLSCAIEASSVVVIITDQHGNIEYVNPRFTEVTGYTKQEAIGRNINRSLVDPDQNTVFDEILIELKTRGEWKGDLCAQKKSGHFYRNRCSMSVIRNSDGEISHLVSIQEDVSKEYKMLQQISYQASHDALTGLISRREFERQVERLLSTICEDGCEHVLCYLDLDQFKIVNDTCGHAAGDELLRQIATLFLRYIRQNDILARLGGDEFGVLMEQCSVDDALIVTTSLKNAARDHQFIWEGRRFKVGVSIGLIAIDKTSPNLNELLRKADTACYLAKDLGRNRIHVYRPNDVELIERDREMQWVIRIHRALEDASFCLHAQPIVSLSGQPAKHYEILLRMKSQHGELIMPGAFIPAAERYQLMVQLDSWVIQQVLTLFAQHPGLLGHHSLVCINLSGQSLTDKTFLEFVVRQIRNSGFKADRISFEITETAVIANLNTAITFISTLKDLGCHFALDDFGSGFASFGYLKRLPIDYLKIDGMFVRGIVDDPVNYAMVKSIHEIAEMMGIETVAEYVEDEMTKQALAEIGINYVQGYHIGKPVTFNPIAIVS